MPQLKHKEINFFVLFKIFRLKVIFQWIFTTIRSVISYITIAILINIIRQNGKIENFVELFPNIIKKLIFLNETHWESNKFIIFGFILILIYSLIYYYDNLWEEELRIKGSRYIKNRLIDKFQSLPFTERQIYKKEINNLANIESLDIGRFWNHLYNHVYHSFLTIFLVLWDNFQILEEMSIVVLFFSFTFILVINVIIFFLLQTLYNGEKKYKEKLAKENNFINEENNKSILIDSMGLSSYYYKKRKNIIRDNENFLLSFIKTKSFSNTISRRLIDTYPFFILLLSGKIVTQGLFIFWEIFENMREIFGCLQDYGNYNSSLKRANNFLKLSEKNNNLSGLLLEGKTKIEKIVFNNLSFRYASNSDWILKDYNHTFTKDEINKLSGKNGTGKSTIIYLLLGMIDPCKGEILLHGRNQKIYNLNKEINLKQWREKKVLYCSHDNLLEKGSTGQKQITNFKNALKTKNEAEVIILDEATNALDKKNWENIRKQLEKLLEKNKIVISAEHLK